MVTEFGGVGREADTSLAERSPPLSLPRNLITPSHTDTKVTSQNSPTCSSFRRISPRHCITFSRSRPPALLRHLPQVFTSTPSPRWCFAFCSFYSGADV
ncbi:unnamed protein product [Tilletia caries]|uniref:Uncharacterized protein n=1 Tax=Tilletia caries TaxID=13290 RepID=A0ABN7J4L2_9BASI|nr:unnamed protein product [Tilletia caries]CAD6952001.1 unnamed protein product [Tilletia caries]